MAINWIGFGETVGMPTAFLGAAAWLIKALVSHRMTRDADQFRMQLQHVSDTEIEKLRSSLQMAALEHQVRFSKLHERQGEVIAELYKLLLETSAIARGFIYNDTRNPTEAERANNKALQLYQFIEVNRLYLPESICSLLEAIAQPSAIRS